VEETTAKAKQYPAGKKRGHFESVNKNKNIAANSVLTFRVW
jgi:hypothetical protein